jgi:hypothetical protein
MPNFKIALLAILAIAIFAGIMLASSPKTTLVVNGNNNIAYTGAINQIYGEGLQKVSNETARLANAYIADQDPGQIVLLDPTAENVKDFVELAQYHNAQLIIGSVSNETELKSQLFELGLDNKKVQFQTNQDWDPDNYENIGRGYTY